MATDRSDTSLNFKCSLPALSDSERDSLALFRRDLLAKHGLTGPHLDWHRYELARIASRLPYGWPAEEAADAIGISQSRKVAEGLFERLCELYWQHWLSSGARFETLAGWLNAIQQQVLTEVESVWAGSEAVVRWYRRACEPAVKKALAAKAKAKELEASPTREQMLLQHIRDELRPCQPIRGTHTQDQSQLRAADALENAGGAGNEPAASMPVGVGVDDQAAESPRRPGHPRSTPNLHPDVEPYLDRVSKDKDAPRRIIIADFCLAAGFGDDTYFGAWRRGDGRCPEAAAKSFERTLKLLPKEFLEKLELERRKRLPST
jgi:hypothetical protein